MDARMRPRSDALYREALLHIAGGVNSPSRSFKAVGGGAPVFMKRAKGAYFWDEDGNRYIDYLAGFGPIILGHAHPDVVEAVCRAAADGTLYGTPTEREVVFARMLKAAIPSLEQVRLVNSGTEAVMSVVRLARAYTERTKIIKFAGCYHGHFDAALVAAGSGPSTIGVPDSAGVPANVAGDVITVPYNDPAALDAALDRWGRETAAVMIEPIVGNFGIVMPKPGFLEHLCRAARAYGALVVYDEVISAFRFHYGAAQTFAAFPDAKAVEPDLTALGKIIGGGLPIGAYGGRADIMGLVAPLGPAYQAGTAAGNPVSVAAGIACLEALARPGVYEHLDRLGRKLEEGLMRAARTYGIPLAVNRVVGALSTHFGVSCVEDYAGAQAADDRMFAQFFRLMLDQGIYLAPSKFEAWFITLAHTDADIEETVQAAERAFAQMASEFRRS